MSVSGFKSNYFCLFLKFNKKGYSQNVDQKDHITTPHPHLLTFWNVYAHEKSLWALFSLCGKQNYNSSPLQVLSCAISSLALGFILSVWETQNNTLGQKHT